MLEFEVNEPESSTSESGDEFDASLRSVADSNDIAETIGQRIIVQSFKNRAYSLNFAVTSSGTPHRCKTLVTVN
ncbi:unnamed protein product, partial [Rotaria sp. Silwood2]